MGITGKFNRRYCLNNNFLCHVILGMCEIDVLFRFGFGSALKKNSYSVRNDFGSVQFEKKPRFGSNIIVIYYLCNS